MSSRIVGGVGVAFGVTAGLGAGAAHIADRLDPSGESHETLTKAAGITAGAGLVAGLALIGIAKGGLPGDSIGMGAFMTMVAGYGIAGIGVAASGVAAGSHGASLIAPHDD